MELRTCSIDVLLREVIKRFYTHNIPEFVNNFNYNLQFFPPTDILFAFVYYYGF